MKNYLEEVKSIAKIPVMMGFCIRTAKDVDQYIEIIDGCIVGSHFINIMEKSNYDIDTIKEYIATFKSELNKSTYF